MTRKLSKEQRAVIREIKRLDRRGEALNISAVKRNQPDLIAAAFAVKPFWGWKCAIEDAGLDYRRIRKQLEPYVYCEICGEPYLSLGRHLVCCHGAASFDYLIDYPDSALMSEEYLAEFMVKRRKGRRKPPVRHWEPFWTKEYVLDRMWAFYQKQVPMNYAAMTSLEPALPPVATKHFGDWDSALKRLGLDPVKIRILSRPLQHSNEKVIEIIRRIHKRDVSLAYRDMLRSDRAFLCCARSCFGGWREAVRAAGVDYESIRLSDPRVKYPEAEDVVREIRRRKRRKEALSVSGVRAYSGREGGNGALFSKAVYFFGTWREAVEAAGFRYDRVCEPRRGQPRKHPTAQDVVSAIRRRKRGGLPLNVLAVNGNDATGDRTLYNSAVREFGSWNRAIEKAGLNIHTVRKMEWSPYQTREQVIRAIRERKRAGLSLILMKMKGKGKRRDGTLVYSATRFFGSWRAAVEAAGIDYDRIVGRPERKYPTPESALQAIQVRKRKGFPLNSGAVCHGPHPDKALYDWAIKYFGSWRKALSAAGIDPDRVKRIWRKYGTAAEVLREIRRRKGSREPLNFGAMRTGPYLDLPLTYAASVEFGSWRAAVEKAGLVCPVRRRKYPDSRAVVTEIKRRRREGLPLNTAAIGEGPHRDVGLRDNGAREFGSWLAAVEAAGIDPETVRKNRRKYATSAQVLKEIRRRKRSGKPLNTGALQSGSCADGPLHNAGCIEFGSWRAALEAAGIDPEMSKKIRRKYATLAQVLKEIRGRKRAGRPLTVAALQAPGADRALLYAGRIEYDSWQAAVKAAGFVYPSSQQRKYPDRNAVIDGIKRRGHAGMLLSAYALDKGPHCDRVLHISAVREFGSLRVAVEAAGLEYPRACHGRYPDSRAVIAEIRRRRRDNILTSVAVHRDRALQHSARREFGSWRAALEAAGIKPDDMKTTRRKC